MRKTLRKIVPLCLALAVGVPLVGIGPATAAAPPPSDLRPME